MKSGEQILKAVLDFITSITDNTPHTLAIEIHSTLLLMAPAMIDTYKIPV